ncbi:MAG: hypothetical protein KDD15_01230 [Lewinella sp.]|nr:hypothetical protein [Lewinella sp.]
MKWYAGGITALTVITMTGLIFFWLNNRSLKQDKAEQEAAIFTYTEQIEQLNGDIDSLMRAYEDLTSENQSLQGSVEDAAQLLAGKDAELNRIKKQSARNLKAKQEEVDQLLAFKAELEETLAGLEEENFNLQEENARLSKQLDQAITENNDLARRLSALEYDKQYLQQHLDQLVPMAFQGSAFKVEVQKRNEKLTVKGKKARQMDISFDLLNTPEEWQGMRTIYLSIVDSKGLPVKTGQNKNVQLQLPNGTNLSFETQLTKELHIGLNQRLAFHLELDDKITAGNYRANVYTTSGLMGSVGFRLSR